MKSLDFVVDGGRESLGLGGTPVEVPARICGTVYGVGERSEM